MSARSLNTARIRELTRSDHDLIERDRDSAERYVFSQHCERMWEKLSNDERDRIRRSVSDRHDGPRSGLLLDYECLKELGRMIQDAEAFPAPVTQLTAA